MDAEHRLEGLMVWAMSNVVDLVAEDGDVNLYLLDSYLTVLLLTQGWPSSAMNSLIRDSRKSYPFGVASREYALEYLGNFERSFGISSGVTP